MKEEDILLIGALGVGAIFLLSKKVAPQVQDSIGADIAIPGKTDTARARAPFGVNSGDVTKVVSNIAGPGVGQLAGLQWSISPSSVIGGIAFGPVGTGVGFVKDTGGKIVSGVKNFFGSIF